MLATIGKRPFRYGTGRFALLIAKWSQRPGLSDNPHLRVLRSLSLLAFGAPAFLVAQVLVPTVITQLDPVVNETSGLVVVNGEVWTQLDSGNPNAIYRIDPVNGAVLRSVTLSNATNVDWEEITTDEEWLYIGDFGNNLGSRTDLRVYRVSLSELLEPATMSLVADTIRFSYALQTDFTPADRANDWDMEAMIARDDSLFLFSKNWVSGTSYLYALPADPGEHLAIRRDTLEAQGLITGATYDPSNNAVALVGYTSGLYLPFVWRFANYPGHAFFQGVAQRNTLGVGITQMEAIAWAGPSTTYLSNEQSILNAARLWELQLELPTTLVHMQGNAAQLWPTPNDGRFIIEVDAPCDLELFDVDGRGVWQQVLRPGTNHIDVGELPNGIYVVRTSAANEVERMSIVR